MPPSPSPGPSNGALTMLLKAASLTLPSTARAGVGCRLLRGTGKSRRNQSPLARQPDLSPPKIAPRLDFGPGNSAAQTFG